MYGNGWQFRIPNKGDLDLLHDKINPSLIYFWMEGVNSVDVRKLYGERSAARLFSQVKDAFSSVLFNDLVVCSRILLLYTTGKYNVLRASQHTFFAEQVKSHVDEIITIKYELLEHIILRSFLLGLNVLKLLGQKKKYNEFYVIKEAIYSRYGVGESLQRTCESSAKSLKSVLFNLFESGDIFSMYGASDNHPIEYLEYNFGLINIDGVVDKAIAQKLSAPLSIDDFYEGNQGKIQIRPFFWLYRLVALYSALSSGNKNIDLACLRYARSALYEKCLDNKTENQIGLLIVKEAI